MGTITVKFESVSSTNQAEVNTSVSAINSVGISFRSGTVTVTANLNPST